MITCRWHVLGIVLAYSVACTGSVLLASSPPTSVADIAFYKGPDRQKILEEGAKKEGKLVFYTSGILTQGVRPVVDAFQKKYPYIKVDIWRAGADALVPKIMEEYRADKLLASVVEGTNILQFALQQVNISQQFYSPNLEFIEEGAIKSAPGGGALAVAFRSQGNSLSYNTRLVMPVDAPKTYDDLLDAKWKGKMAISGGEVGKRLLGTMYEVKGEDFVKKFANQGVTVHVVSVRAILDMVIAGEYPISPNTTDAHVETSRRKGAPVAWVPLEPVSVGVGQIALTRTAPHPYAAMLFIDFELSRETAELYKSIGYTPTRVDVQGERIYKKFFGPRSLEEAERWNVLFERLFQK